MFVYDLNGMEMIIVYQSPPDVVDLGTLSFTDSAGDRPDLLKAFLEQNPHLTPIKLDIP